MHSPNVLLVIMDTQRRNNLSCYGYGQPTSPHLERIAEQGTLFENAISPGGWTLPSHASIYTGRHLASHGASITHEFARHTYPTLAQILSDAGYATVGINNNAWADVALGMQHRHELPPGFLEYYTSDGDPAQSERGALVQRAIWWLQNVSRERPFFMFINLPYPHLTCWPPEPHRSRFLPEGVSDEEARAVEQTPYAILTGAVTPTEREWGILRALNDGETAYTDAEIGRLVADLETLNLLDDTLLIVTSDHGDILGGRGNLMAHQLHLYDELIHLPLLVRYPEAFPGGSRVDALCQTHDIYATIVDILGLDVPCPPEQSVSLLRIARGELQRAFAISERAKPLQFFERVRRYDPGFDFRPYNASCKVVRTRQWKYFWWSDGRDELYDLVEDPGETDNVVSSHAGQARVMRRQLLDWLQTIDVVDYGDALNDIDGIKGVRPDIVRELCSLGLYRSFEPPGT